MYRCNDCGGEFEEWELSEYKESRPIGFETFSCCPYCGRRDYEEICMEEEGAA